MLEFQELNSAEWSREVRRKPEESLLTVLELVVVRFVKYTTEKVNVLLFVHETKFCNFAKALLVEYEDAESSWNLECNNASSRTVNKTLLVAFVLLHSTLPTSVFSNPAFWNN